MIFLCECSNFDSNLDVSLLSDVISSARNSKKLTNIFFTNVCSICAKEVMFYYLAQYGLLYDEIYLLM